MKRLNVAQPKPEDMPQEYKQMREVNLDEHVEEVKPPSVPHELPKSDLYKRLKKLSSFKQIKKDYKLEAQRDVFVSDLKELFKHLNIQEHKFDTDLLLELLNSVEEYYVYGSKQEREKQKETTVRELMLPFFENERILTSFVKTLQGKVKKSNMLRRLFKRVFHFFL